MVRRFSLMMLSSNCSSSVHAVVSAHGVLAALEHNLQARMHQVCTECRSYKPCQWQVPQRALWGAHPLWCTAAHQKATTLEGAHTFRRRDSIFSACALIWWGAAAASWGISTASSLMPIKAG